MPAIPLPFSNQSTTEWILQFQKAEAAEDRFRALQAIGSLCPPDEASRSAVVALLDEHPTVRALGAKLIGSLVAATSDETKLQLTRLLTDPDPDVRFESGRALIRQKASKVHLAVPVLLTFLDEPETHPLMVAAVLNSIVDADLSPDTADKELKQRIEPFLTHDRAEVREAVAGAFAKWPRMSITCMNRLLPLLDDSEPIVREKIAEALGQAGIVTEEITSALRTASQDEDTEVARTAAEAMKRLGV